MILYINIDKDENGDLHMLLGTYPADAPYKAVDVLLTLEKAYYNMSKDMKEAAEKFGQEYTDTTTFTEFMFRKQLPND